MAKILDLVFNTKQKNEGENLWAVSFTFRGDSGGTPRQISWVLLAGSIMLALDDTCAARVCREDVFKAHVGTFAWGVHPVAPACVCIRPACVPPMLLSLGSV